MVSSRVGVTTSAWIFSAPGLIFSKIGSKKARVLPVPVCAWTMTSRPLRTAGIEASCTGVAVRIPLLRKVSQRGIETPNSLKFFIFIILILCFYNAIVQESAMRTPSDQRFPKRPVYMSQQGGR